MKVLELSLNKSPLRKEVLTHAKKTLPKNLIHLLK